jgi:hypothetical protein
MIGTAKPVVMTVMPTSVPNPKTRRQAHTHRGSPTVATMSAGAPLDLMSHKHRDRFPTPPTVRDIWLGRSPLPGPMLEFERALHGERSSEHQGFAEKPIVEQEHAVV